MTTDQDEIRFISASGSIGSGIVKSALDAVMECDPHFISCDAGTTDAGAYYLGSGKTVYPREAVKDDLTLVLLAGSRAQVPVILGSAGTAGGDPHVDWTLEIVREIAAEHGLKLKVAVIRTEQDKQYLTTLLQQGRIRPLEPAPVLDQALIERSVRIVGMMGVEAIQTALRSAPDLVLGGRCSDAAAWAAIPIMKGFPAGLAWHAGKLLECGTSGVVESNKAKGVVLCTLRRDHFVIRAFGVNMRCTPHSVAAHSLYENSNPILHEECSGTLDLTHSIYRAEDDSSVRVSGSIFTPSGEFTVKLEGAELVGYQSLMIGGIRDPLIIARLDDWLQEVRLKIEAAVERILGARVRASDYRLIFHVYGRDAVMGTFEPNQGFVPNEVGIVVEATAAMQEIASKIVELCRQPFLHHPIPEWKGSITSFACLHSPACVERGPVYQFNLHHVVLPHHQEEMFRHEIINF